MGQMVEGFLQGFQALLSFQGILALILGSTLGFVFGVIPGLTGGMAMALLIPFTWGMSPAIAMYLLAGAFGASSQGGAIPALLIKIPGVPSQIVATFDGPPMTRRGEGARALGLASSSAGFGALFGVFTLILVIPVAGIVIRSIAAPEFFWLILFALIVLCFVSQGNILRGLASAALGLHLSWIGFSAVFGTERFIGKSEYLYDGIPAVPFIVIGMMAIPEIFNFILGGSYIADDKIDRKKLTLRATLAGFLETFRYPGILIRGSIIGTIVGITPGIGSGTAAAISYSLAKRFSKWRNELGTGHPVGIVAAEAPCDAVEGSALIPTLLFGIPGSADMVIFLGAFMLHGIQPGTAMFSEHMDVVWSLIVALVVSNLWASCVLVFIRGFFVRLVNLPKDYIAAFILVVGLAGTFGLRQNIWDVLLVVCAGLLGYSLKRFGFPILPAVIAFILGPLLEKSFLQAFNMGYKSLTIFITRPISALLILFIIGLLVAPLIKRRPKAGH